MSNNRYTIRRDDGTYDESDSCKNIGRGYLLGTLLNRLGHYEDLEDKISEEYGSDNDDILSKAVDILTYPKKLDGSQRKVRLLTDNDADEWEQYKKLRDDKSLLEIPCMIGDTVYVKMCPYTYSTYSEAVVVDYTFSITTGFCVVVKSKSCDNVSVPFTEFGKTIFRSVSELKEARNRRIK